MANMIVIEIDPSDCRQGAQPISTLALGNFGMDDSIVRRDSATLVGSYTVKLSDLFSIHIHHMGEPPPRQEILDLTVYNAKVTAFTREAC